MKRLVILLLVLLTIPTLGLVADYAIRGKMEAQFSAAIARLNNPSLSGLTIHDACANPRMRPAIPDACSQLDFLFYLGLTSIVCAGISIGMILLIVVGALLVGMDRGRLLLLFGIGRRFLLIILGLLILAQGAIAACAFYLMEAEYLGRVHLFLIGAVGLGALIGGVRIFKAGFAFAKRPEIAEFAVAVSREEQPRLWGFVTDIAEKLGARPPNHIILALNTNFYATAADVSILRADKPLFGETLCLSLPLMRIFDKEELAAVVGHELGHFSGRDTEYTLRFVPVYSDLSKALAIASDDGSASGAAMIPAAALLGFFMERFAHAERRIGRLRELEADKAGAKAASPGALASALVKAATLGPAWIAEGQQMIELLNAGRVLVNGSLLFQGMAEASLRELPAKDLASAIVEYRMPHPTDTHPPLSVRLEALGASLEGAAAAVAIPASAAIALLDDYAQLEELLTEVQAHVFLRAGAATPPEPAQAVPA